MANRSPSINGRWGAGVALGFVLVVIGCSVQKNYKTLSFFFDGVPDPNAQTGTKRGTMLRPVYVHKPYAEAEKTGNCDVCHLQTDDIFSRAKVKENLCISCHAPVQQEYAVMHGPVGAAACRECHAAHTSANQHLLKLPAPGLCMNCHEQDFLSAGVPQHKMPKVDCLTCHSGHGGADRKFLKPNWQTIAASQPAGGGAVH